jgi:hypothetical protein
LLYIIGDFIVDFYQFYLLSNRISEVRKQYMKTGGSEMYATLQSLLSERRSYYMTFAINLCNLPMALEWSLNDGILPDIGIPLFGSVGSLLGLYRKWTSL